MKYLFLCLTVLLSMSFSNIDETINDEVHKVSWYGGKFHGRKTASGEVYNKWAYTCAATKKYKLGTYLKVTNIKNNKSVVVKVNDRGAFAKYGRTLDLSRAAFNSIGNLNTGVIKVTIEKVNKKLAQ